jgi:transposase
MPRTQLSDEHWLKLYPILREVGIYGKSYLRLTLEGILYRLRVGCPWRDVPKEFGKWNNLYRRFNEWSRKGKIVQIFKMLVVDPDLEWEFIDGSIVKAHQHSSGCKKKEESAIGRSVAGNSTKYTWQLILLDSLLSLKLLEARYTIVNKHQNFLQHYLLLITR